ncbi:MAG: response regulator [Alphaproteobacteria bacterium]|nr:response regulator [Alphaproteobacteria bacterium]
MRLDDILQDFLSEAEERFQALEAQLVTLERRPEDARALAEVFRAAHSLKGTCGFLGFRRLGDLAHAAEDLLSQVRGGALPLLPDSVSLLLAALDGMRLIVAEIKSSGAEPQEIPPEEQALRAALAAAAEGQSFSLPSLPIKAGRAALPAPVLRVQSDVFDNLLALSGEIALVRERLKVANAIDAAGAAQFAQLTQNLQAEVLRGRLQPVMEAWRSLPRLVRDLAAGAGLSVRLETEGGETLLDRQVLDVIRDPIAHLVRNCLSHGLEPSKNRRAAGKPPEGVIYLSARAAEGQVVITVSDDGRGFDLEAIRQKALATGIATAAQIAVLTDVQVAGLVFARHFSTAAQVGDMAGRGVGLDAAAAQLASIGGTITAMPPETGKGAVFTMRVPLTLAMLPAVLVTAGKQTFVLPRSAVLRFCRRDGAVQYAGARPVFYHEGVHLPLLSLPLSLEAAALVPPHEGGFAVIVRAERMTAALAIDGILWTGDIVVKPVPEILQDTGVYLGLALLANGAPAMIVDVRRLLARCGVAVQAEEAAETAPHSADMQRILTFDLGGLCALPVSVVETVQRFSPAALHTAQDGGQYYACDDKLLPICLSAAVKDPAFVLILRQDTQRVCLPCRTISGVVDIPAQDARPGSRMIGGRPADVLAVENLFVQVDETSGATDDKGRILLIDDSPFFCGLLTPVLEQAGYRVEVAADVASALSLRDHGGRFDLIISDIEMPDMDGLAFARAVRAEGSAWRETPLLALSAHATRHDESRGRAAGFDDFITKFDRTKLLVTLSNIRQRA